MLIPRIGHHILIEHKSINNQPFLEVTIYDKNNNVLSDKAVDRTQIPAGKNLMLDKIIHEWMFEQQ